MVYRQLNFFMKGIKCLLWWTKIKMFPITLKSLFRWKRIRYFRLRCHWIEPLAARPTPRLSVGVTIDTKRTDRIMSRIHQPDVFEWRGIIWVIPQKATSTWSHSVNFILKFLAYFEAIERYDNLLVSCSTIMTK